MESFNAVTTESMSMEEERCLAAKERRNLILFAAGQGVSLLGAYIYSFAVSLYILKVTGSATSFAFSLLVSTVPRVLLSPVAGSVSDRVDKKKMIVRLDLLSGFTLAALFAVTLIYGIQLPLIYATSFIISVISTFFNNCFMSAIPALVLDRSLMKINACSRSINSMSQILGPVLGGMVFGLIPMQLFFLMTGIAYILSGISEMFIDFRFNKSRVGESKEKSPLTLKVIGSDIVEVVRFIRGNKLLRVAMPFSISCNFLISASLSVALPYVVNNLLRMSPAQYGIIEAAIPVGMLLAAIVIGKLPEKEKKRKGLFVGILGMGVMSIGLGLPVWPAFMGWGLQTAFFFYMAVLFLFAVFLIMMDMPFGVVMQRIIPGDMLGRVTGVLSTISSGLIPLGILLGGILMDRIPAYFVFFAMGIYFVGGAFYMYNNNAMKEY